MAGADCLGAGRLMVLKERFEMLRRLDLIRVAQQGQMTAHGHRPTNVLIEHRVLWAGVNSFLAGDAMRGSIEKSPGSQC